MNNSIPTQPPRKIPTTPSFSYRWNQLDAAFEGSLTPYSSSFQDCLIQILSDLLNRRVPQTHDWHLDWPCMVFTSPLTTYPSSPKLEKLLTMAAIPASRHILLLISWEMARWIGELVLRKIRQIGPICYFQKNLPQDESQTGNNCYVVTPCQARLLTDLDWSVLFWLYPFCRGYLQGFRLNCPGIGHSVIRGFGFALPQVNGPPWALQS